jgi:TRAP-type mannitol/chloroaromatic compound transport system permease small subunit
MKLINALIEIFAKLAAFLVITLSFLVVYDSVNRYFFSGGSIALQELEWHIFDIIFLIGLSYTLKHDKHVRVDIFYHNYSKKTKAIINIISQLFLILPFTILILYVSFGYIELSYTQNEISPDPGGLSYRWMIKSMMIVGFVLLGLQSISEIFKNVKRLKID